jgi:hypothetical protein
MLPKDSDEFRAHIDLQVKAAYGARYRLVLLCACCGHPLTSKESLVRGMGPICARKAAR